MQRNGLVDCTGESLARHTPFPCRLKRDRPLEVFLWTGSARPHIRWELNRGWYA
jgi:hypothetical protein